MSAVHDRWELVEPLLFAHPLRDASAFQIGETNRSQAKVLKDLQRQHRFESGAIAQAYNLFDEDAFLPPSIDEPIHASICSTSTRWLVANGDHWGLRIVRRRPGHEIVRWRGVTMLVSPSIIVAGALAKTERSHPCRVQTLPDAIAPREPVGHLHVHLGPMLPFEELWWQLWNAFLQRGTLDFPNGNGLASIAEEDVPEIVRPANKRQQGLRWQWILELAFVAKAFVIS